MKKFRTVFTFLIVAVVFVLSGCMEEGKAWTDTDPSAMPVPTKASSIETVSIYSVNSDNMTLIPVSVRKEMQDPTPDYVADLVMENLNEEDSSKGKPVKGCGSKMETLILEAFANSLLDNVEDCEKVIFRCDGKEYKSSQYSFGKNEVFASE